MMLILFSLSASLKVRKPELQADCEVNNGNIQIPAGDCDGYIFTQSTCDSANNCAVTFTKTVKLINCTLSDSPNTYITTNTDLYIFGTSFSCTVASTVNYHYIVFTVGKFEMLHSSMTDSLTNLKGTISLLSFSSVTFGFTEFSGLRRSTASGSGIDLSVSITNNRVEFNNCTITDVSIPVNGNAGVGGFIKQNQCTNIGFFGCKFTECYGYYDGGTLHFQTSGASVIECTFDNCKSNDALAEGTSGGGNALGCDSSTLIEITGCKFINMRGSRIIFASGASKNIEGVKYLIITSCIFSNVSCTNYGGIGIKSTGQINLIQCTMEDIFSNSDGGILKSSEGSKVFIQYCNITNCKTTNGNGGAFGIIENKIFFYEHTIFSNCQASKSGAFIYHSTGTATVNNCTFENPISSTGALYIHLQCVISQISLCTFKKLETALSISYFYFKPTTANAFQINNCTFENIHTSDGNFFTGENMNSFTVDNCYFIRNDGNNGILFKSIGSIPLHVINSRFDSNNGYINIVNQGSVQNCSFTGDHKHILFEAPINCEFSGCTFESCATQAIVSGALNEDDHYIVKNLHFINITATTFGGLGFGISGDSYHDFIGCTYERVHCGQWSIFEKAATKNLIYTNCEFTNCDGGSTGFGVAFYTKTMPCTATNCKFINLTSGASGGAVHVGAQSSFIDCLFENCRATNGNGGAIYFDIVATLTLTNCVFEGNEASGDGGCIYFANDGAVLSCNSITANSNKAGGKGALIFYGNTPSIVIPTITGTNNEASNGIIACDGKNAANYQCGDVKGVDLFVINAVSFTLNAVGDVSATSSILDITASAISITGLNQINGKLTFNAVNSITIKKSIFNEISNIELNSKKVAIEESKFSFTKASEDQTAVILPCTDAIELSVSGSCFKSSENVFPSVDSIKILSNSVSYNIASDNCFNKPREKALTVVGDAKVGSHYIFNCVDCSQQKTNKFILSDKFSFSKNFENTKVFTVTNNFMKSNIFSISKNFENTNPFTHSGGFIETEYFSISNLLKETHGFTHSENFDKSKNFDSTNKFAKSNMFSVTKNFKETAGFIGSSIFHDSNQFSTSYLFRKSIEFSISSLFETTDKFSGSTDFSITNKFFNSEKFTESQDFVQTNHYSSTNEFSLSSDFPQSQDYAQTNHYSSTNEFSLSSDFPQSQDYAQTNHYSLTNEFSLSSYFPESQVFAQTNYYSLTNKFYLSPNFPQSQVFLKSGEFSCTGRLFETIESSQSNYQKSSLDQSDKTICTSILYSSKMIDESKYQSSIQSDIILESSVKEGDTIKETIKTDEISSIETWTTNELSSEFTSLNNYENYVRDSSNEQKDTIITHIASLYVLSEKSSNVADFKEYSSSSAFDSIFVSTKIVEDSTKIIGTSFVESGKIQIESINKYESNSRFESSQQTKNIISHQSETNQAETEATESKILSKTIYASHYQSDINIETSEDQNHNKESYNEINKLSFSSQDNFENLSDNFPIISNDFEDAEITNKSKAGMIAGIVIGVIVIIVIIVLLTYFLLIRKKQHCSSSDIDLNDDFETNDSVEISTIDNPLNEDFKADKHEESSSQDYTYEEIGFYIPEA